MHIYIYIYIYIYICCCGHGSTQPADNEPMSTTRTIWIVLLDSAHARRHSQRSKGYHRILADAELGFGS